MVSPYLNGRQENNFKDPIVYRPERFMRDPDSIDTAYFYFNFSFIFNFC